MSEESVRPSREFWTRLRRWAKGRIEIDTRTLAVFRMLVGVLIIADLLARAPRFSYFYTENGVLPRSYAMDMAPDNAFSVYFFTTDPTVTAAFFVLQGIIAVQLIIGYQARIAMILSFLLVMSLDHRNLLVTSYADTLFRFLLFWAMFLPLGERWSIDAIHSRREPRVRIASLATAAILVQMVYMYLVNGYHKWDGGLWSDGEAVILIFGLDDITWFIGDSLRSFPTMLQYGGMLWYYMLLFSPLLLVLSGRLRMLFVALFLGGHGSFALTVRIGAFPYVGIAGVMLFLQSEFWDDARRFLRFIRVRDAWLATLRTGVETPAQHVAAWLPNFQVAAEWPRAFMVGASNFLLVVSVVAVLVLPSFELVSDSKVLGVDLGEVDRQNREMTGMLGVTQPPWTVFAPSPRRTDRWHVIAAQTVDGELFDVYNDRPLIFERPYRQLNKQYKTYRERFYMNGVRRAGEHGAASRLLAEYLCRTWEEERGIELTHLNIYAISETVTVDTVNNPDERESQTDLIYMHGCGENVAREIALPPSDDRP